MNIRRHPHRWTAARLVLSLGLVALVASRVDLAAFGATLAHADLGWLALAWLLALGSWLPASWKWQRLLASLGSHAPLRELFALNLVGLFYSLFLPGQVGGEVVKGIKLARRGVSGAQTAVSIGVDRLTGVMALAVLALGGMALAPPVEGAPALAFAAAGILLLSVAPLLALVATSHLGWRSSSPGPSFSSYKEERGRRFPLPAWAGGLAARAIGVLLTLGRSFLEYRRSPRTLAEALALAALVQAIIVLSNYAAALALGIAVPFTALLWIVALVSVLHLVPVALAGLGVREGAYVVLLSRYGVPTEQGLALALAVFGIIVAQGLTGGLVEVVSGLGRSPQAQPDADATAAPSATLLRDQ